MTITADAQKLEPGALVRVYELDATMLGAGMIRFHAHTQVGSIWWQGAEYSPWPIEADGFAATTGQPPRPTLRVANVNAAVTAILQLTDDLIGAKLTVRSTLGQYLDAANFGGVNPTADPNEHFPDEVWFVERKSAETKEVIELELVSALDFQGVQLPRRQIIANQCPWRYRSAECGYTGGPVADASDNPTSDPALDQCSKKLTGCKLRFGEEGELPFGGFPAAGLMRF